MLVTLSVATATTSYAPSTGLAVPDDRVRRGARRRSDQRADEAEHSASSNPSSSSTRRSATPEPASVARSVSGVPLAARTVTLNEDEAGVAEITPPEVGAAVSVIPR